MGDKELADKSKDQPQNKTTLAARGKYSLHCNNERHRQERLHIVMRKAGARYR